MTPMEHTPLEGDEQRTESHQPVQDQPGSVEQAVLAGETVYGESLIQSAERIDHDTAVIDALKRVGLAKTRELVATRERQGLQRLPAIRASGSRLRTLEEAAEVLIAELEPNHQDAIAQIVLEIGHPNWVIILGAVARMADLQELHAGDFQADWTNRGAGQTKVTAKQEVCEVCAGLIPPDPVRRGRKFCCSRHGSGQIAHSDDCPNADRQMKMGQWVTVPGVV